MPRHPSPLQTVSSLLKSSAEKIWQRQSVKGEANGAVAIGGKSTQRGQPRSVQNPENSGPVVKLQSIIPLGRRRVVIAHELPRWP